MFGYKSVVAALTVATMVGSSAFAADTSLAPGKPAGALKAQGHDTTTGTLLIAGGLAAVITAVAITVSNQSGDRTSTSTFATATTG